MTKKMIAKIDIFKLNTEGPLVLCVPRMLDSLSPDEFCQKACRISDYNC